MRELRRRVLEAPDDADDWRASVRRFTDFFTLSGCRDLLFHVREHRFTPLQIREALTVLGLEFRGLDVGPAILADFRRRFPGDGAALDLALWDDYEAANPQAFSGMIGLWCRKPEEGKP